MITFFPGPSKVYPEVLNYFQDAFNKGILSINHRSSEFTTISKRCVELLKEKLNIPQDYTVYFTSSATEGWEITAQSLTEKYSFHLFNGAFGKKWYEYTTKLGKETKSYQFDINVELDPVGLNIDSRAEVICITQNETSNGTQVKNDIIAKFRDMYPEKLIAVDATSSIAGISLDFKNADIWLGSVQKCFGLPAGLGIYICSPRAMQRAVAINENNHYNSLLFIEDNMKNWQTNYTPNVLNIYLLMRVMENVKNINEVGSLAAKRAKDLYDYLDGFSELRSLIQNPRVQSDTIVAVAGTEEYLAEIKSKAKAEAIHLGNGYGPWKPYTFRIANFPAITDQEVSVLKEFLKKTAK
ncbi:MAG TPA: aminotransferase class V-fold PLP-dependent enzyme [Cytophagales bacterium]|nr:aminotransferase class V-fold PLP-dependent enzyme [Cytophagales bacterium]